MENHNKTKSELIAELKKLRRQLGKLSSQKSKKTRSKKTSSVETLLRTIIDILPDAVYVKDVRSKKIIANLADLRNVGCQSESEVVGKDDFAFFPKDVAEKFFADDQSVIKNGVPVVNREESFVDRQGMKHWLLTSKLPLWDDDGNVTGLVGISRDITSRRQAEMELRRQKIEFQQLFENIAFGIAMCDKSERIIQVNSRFEAMFQFKAEEVVGRYINELVIPDHLVNEGTEVSLKLSKQEIVIKETFRKRKDGSLINVRIHGVPVLVEGRPVGVYAIYEELTGRSQPNTKYKSEAA